MSYDNLSSVSPNILKFYHQLTGEERRISFIFSVQHVKIYILCNFEVNLITHLGVIALVPLIVLKKLLVFILYFKNYKR
jgi:hypothetical protein